MDQEYLDSLRRLVEKTNRAIPAWLEDLLLHGPRFEDWPGPGFKPNRIFLTEFLARWLKFAGISEEECLEWLLAYCCKVLKPYSKSGMSAIRHGTKGKTRWAYRSALPFDFETMVQDFPTAGFEGRPPWMPVFAKWWDQLYEFEERARKAYKPPVFVPVVPGKQRFAEQFKKAEEFARQKKAEGLKPGAIVALLNEQGFLTRTGRKWTLSIVNRTLVGCKVQKGPATDPPADKIAEPDERNPDP